jgi:hypothetical protein
MPARLIGPQDGVDALTWSSWQANSPSASGRQGTEGCDGYSEVDTLRMERTGRGQTRRRRVRADVAEALPLLRDEARQLIELLGLLERLVSVVAEHSANQLFK